MIFCCLFLFVWCMVIDLFCCIFYLQIVCCFPLIFCGVFVTDCECDHCCFVMLQLERGLHGVESVVVANFPTKKFSDEYFAAVEDTQYVPLLILTVTNAWFQHFLFHLVFQFKLKILGLSVLKLASICIPFPRLVFNQVWKMCMGKSTILC